jgi:hypothetical protein
VAVSEKINWDFFESIAVLTIENNQKGLVEFAKEAAKVGLPLDRVEIHAWSKITTDNISRLSQDIANSHQKIVQHAWDQGKENVLVLEDDVGFEALYDVHRINHSLEYVKKHGYDILYLGQLPLGPCAPVTDGLTLSTLPMTSHGIVIHRRFMPNVLRHIFNFAQIDVFYASQIHKKRYALYPSFAYQRIVPKQVPEFLQGVEYRKTATAFEFVLFALTLFLAALLLSLVWKRMGWPMFKALCLSKKKRSSKVKSGEEL